MLLGEEVEPPRPPPRPRFVVRLTSNLFRSYDLLEKLRDAIKADVLKSGLGISAVLCLSHR